MKNLIAKGKQRMSSDKAASNSVETIIIIALAVFAGLALFTFILRPTQQSAEGLGNSIHDGIDSILKSDGDMGAVDFSGGLDANPGSSPR